MKCLKFCHIFGKREPKWYILFLCKRYQGNHYIINPNFSLFLSFINQPLNESPPRFHLNNSVIQRQLQQQNKNIRERGLYITFFCLTATFMICHLPRIILNIYEVTMSIERDICEKKHNIRYFPPFWTIILSHFEKLFLIVNSSIHFIFYYVSGKVFRYVVTFSPVCVCF